MGLYDAVDLSVQASLVTAMYVQVIHACNILSSARHVWWNCNRDLTAQCDWDTVAWGDCCSGMLHWALIEYMFYTAKHA